MSTDMSMSGEPHQEEFFRVRVSRKAMLARDIVGFELRAVDGVGMLPAFSAGSHLTVITPKGMRRNYSLCGAPSDLSRYEIAVKRDAGGRGGSASMADDVVEGSELLVSPPRNNFELAPRAKSFIFIAGGIGITPVLSMMRHLKATGNSDFKLYYCTRDAEATAFADVLADEFPGQVLLHHDHGDVNAAYDFWPLLESPTAAHVYCCGPKGLMDSVADMSGHWPSGAVHFESFGVDAAVFAENRPFTARLLHSDRVVTVGRDESLLEALRLAGVSVRSSCESGTCGTCKTGLVAGEAEHRDMVLSDDERTRHIMVCVSRAHTQTHELVLDL